jgi:DNA-directed RNA polymerase specialized sigma24 family protein
MLVDESKTKEIIGRLVQKTTSNPTLWDDLRQEAMIHLWLTEVHRPGQTRSWYLQSCKFHLQHYLASGRSVDSIKRRTGQMPYATQSEDPSEHSDVADPGACVLSFVSARELVSLLSRRLLPIERAVLDCLADGLGPREIGRRLNISHTMVIKHRSKIASLLAGLEHSPRHSHRLLAAPILPPVLLAPSARLVA